MNAVSEGQDCFPLLVLIGLVHVRVFEPVRPVRKNPWSWYRSYWVYIRILLKSVELAVILVEACWKIILHILCEIEIFITSNYLILFIFMYYFPVVFQAK